MSAPHGEHLLLIGSGNPGKQEEWRELLSGIDAVLVVPQDLDPVPPEPAEEGDTFAANAASKARAYAVASGLRTIADDSGLEVDALRGAPGLRSRRFFGEDATAHDRNTKLLALMDGIAQRGARFVCVAALAWPDGRVELFDGEVRGEIAEAPTVARFDPTSRMRAKNTRNASAVHTTPRIATDVSAWTEGSTVGRCVMPSGRYTNAASASDAATTPRLGTPRNCAMSIDPIAYPTTTSATSTTAMRSSAATLKPTTNATPAKPSARPTTRAASGRSS